MDQVYRNPNIFELIRTDVRVKFMFQSGLFAVICFIGTLGGILAGDRLIACASLVMLVVTQFYATLIYSQLDEKGVFSPRLEDR